ncbi:hypothetical protein D3C78_1827760 [compost metagenome]
MCSRKLRAMRVRISSVAALRSPSSRTWKRSSKSKVLALIMVKYRVGSGSRSTRGLARTASVMILRARVRSLS